jgi:hypothetical protein
MGKTNKCCGTKGPFAAKESRCASKHVTKKKKGSQIVKPNINKDKIYTKCDIGFVRNTEMQLHYMNTRPEKQKEKKYDDHGENLSTKCDSTLVVPRQNLKRALD